jgi:hypothetical protein
VSGDWKAKDMKFKLRHLAGTVLVLLGAIWLAGCGPEDSADADYSGTWRGATSNGGTAAFTVEGNLVTSLRIDDPEADIWFPQAVDIQGNSFSAFHETDTATTDDISLQCTFDSTSHGAGNYSIRKGSHALAGTFEASRL